jgi:ribosomal protein S18 acetylase RimI-like enzyme
MTTMSAAGRLQNCRETGIRPFDIGRDLRPVAELISKAFAHELDHRGTAALREMRLMAYMSGFIRMLNRSTGEFNDVFNGFVWVEEGKVVGNITVQRADSHGSRWQIANVAVEPAYRGQGIARQLIQNALDHIYRVHGQWAVLQVYDDNTVARNLYEKIGFENMGGVTEMQIDRAPFVGEPASIPNFHSFGSGQWQLLYELANSQFQAQSQWWRAVRRDDFQLTFEQQIGEWFWGMAGREQVMRQAIRISRKFEAALVMNIRRWRGTHEVKLWTRPEQYGKYEHQLAQWIMAQLEEYPRWPVSVRLSTEHTAAIQAFHLYGFTQQHALLTMRRKIEG